MSAEEQLRRQRFRRWMETYWCAARAWCEQAEYETRLFAAELREFREQNPQPTLKAYMIATAGPERYL